ncbi:MAG: YitT family protein [Erysipelotrichaceae bacterium]|nr:YitT family protein [Erysipelotrichaceae bacterium]
MNKMTVQTIKNLIQITIGCLILAFSVSVFVLPFNILSGGVAGLAVALNVLIDIDSTIIINVLMIILFVVGSVFLGKKFALSTFITTILYPLMLVIINRFEIIVDIDPILASLYAGLLGGAGVGIVFKAGASTGGMDIPPLIINKYTGIKLSTLVLITDAITVFFGMISYGFEAVLIGFIAVWGTSFAIDKVLTFGAERAKAIYVISDKIDKINDMVQNTILRGTTILQAKGGYTREDKEVLLVVLTGNQYPNFMRLVNEIDRQAFLIIQDANEVHGNGFSFDYKI